MQNVHLFKGDPETAWLIKKLAKSGKAENFIVRNIKEAYRRAASEPFTGLLDNIERKNLHPHYA